MVENKSRTKGIKWAQIRPTFEALVRREARKIAEENMLISREEQKRMKSKLFKEAVEAVRIEGGKGTRVHIDAVVLKIVEQTHSLVSKLGGEVNEQKLVTVESEYPEIVAFLRQAMQDSKQVDKELTDSPALEAVSEGAGKLIRWVIRFDEIENPPYMCGGYLCGNE